MRDPHYGHRGLNGEPHGDSNEWVEWDYLLVSAFQLIEDFTDKYGLLVWESESEEVDVIAEKKIDGFQAAIDRRTSRKGYKASPGETFVPRLELRGREWPTYSQWIEQKVREESEEQEQYQDPLEDLEIVNG